jgi:tRNA pseudouridine-54 N-methylase
MVKDVNSMSIKEKALLELKEERTKEAKDKLKGLYRKQADAKKVLANIEREIEDYLLQLEETEKDLEG